MGVSLYLIGKRPAGTSAGDLLPRARRFFESAAGASLEDARTVDAEPGTLLAVKLHPAAEDVELVAEGDDRLVVSAKTTSVGPGYHTWLCALLKRLGAELSIEWEPRDDSAATGDPTGYFHGGARAAVEDAMLEWIAGVCRHVLTLPAGTRDVALSMPQGMIFHADADVVTPTGPRDRAWLEHVAASPRQGMDFFPWWDDGDGPGALLGRALCLMWSDVRWRKPLDDKERARLARVAALLEQANRLDASLELPWREWQEILEYLGAKPTPLHELIARRAGKIPPTVPLVGYRRSPVSVQLPGAWTVIVPGGFVESWDEQGTFCAGEPPRTLWATTFTFPDEGGAPVPAARLLHDDDEPGGERLEHTAGALVGRAVLRQIAAQGATSPGHFELAAESAVPGSIASLTIAYDDARDRDWAIATWKALTHPAAQQQG